MSHTKGAWPLSLAFNELHDFFCSQSWIQTPDLLKPLVRAMEKAPPGSPKPRDRNTFDRWFGNFQRNPGNFIPNEWMESAV